MFQVKSIHRTLAALGTGAMLLGGCGGAQAPENAAEVPAATEAKPAAEPAPAEPAPAAPASAAPAPAAPAPAAPAATAAPHAGPA